MKNTSYSLLTLCVLSFPLAFSVPAESREDIKMDSVKKVADIKLDPLGAVTARARPDAGKDEIVADLPDLPAKTWTEAKAPAAKADDIEAVDPAAVAFTTGTGAVPVAEGDVGEKLLLDGATISKTEEPGRRVGMYGYPTIGGL